MSRTLVLTVVAVVLATLAAIGDADAKRLGGGRSLGTQRQSIAPPASSSGPAANPVMPAQPAAAGAAPADTRRRAALALAGTDRGHCRRTGSRGAAVAFRLARRLRERAAAGAPRHWRRARLPDADRATRVVRRDPLRARAGRVRAGDRAPARVEPVLLPAQPAAPSTHFAGTLPAGFDAAGFLREAKLQFRRLQAAWDAGTARPSPMS